MITSPRLPAGLVRRAAGVGAEVTEAELDRVVELALRRDASTVTIGHGRSAAATAAASAFAHRWEAQGRIVLDVVTWPEEAASWLRRSTSWEPGRTIAFAALGTERAVGLVGADNLPGLTGATAWGGTWAVRDGQLMTDS